MAGGAGKDKSQGKESEKLRRARPKRKAKAQGQSARPKRKAKAQGQSLRSRILPCVDFDCGLRSRDDLSYTGFRKRPQVSRRRYNIGLQEQPPPGAGRPELHGLRQLQRSGIAEQGFEAEVHVNLVVAVEQREAWLVGYEVHCYAAVCRYHYRVLHDS